MKKNTKTLISMVISLLPFNANALTPKINNQEFRHCLSMFQKEAPKNGLSLNVANEIIPKLNLIQKALENDRKQPEFAQTFAFYSKRVNDFRIKNGRFLLKKHKRFLEDLKIKYGIPPQYLIALWGMESNYGEFQGKMPILDSLATLACDNRRGKYFKHEFFQALKIKEKFKIKQTEMNGSWAGAMGQMQFMPTTYMNYAIDGDKDKKTDLWASEKDALASSANFLNKLGWNSGERWGREVILTKRFDYTELGKKHIKSLNEWSQLGVVGANNLPLNTEKNLNATLYLPSGYNGPAFLVYHNFNVIMRWNNSLFYSLSVGYLADRIMGAGHLVKMPSESNSLPSKLVLKAQRELYKKGYCVGKPDGIWGEKSFEALRIYQQRNNLTPDGFLSAEIVKKIMS